MTPDQLHLAIDLLLDHDPHEALVALRHLRAELIELEAQHVDEARARGWSWSSIGRHLGLSKQAAHQRHASRRPTTTTARPEPAPHDYWASINRLIDEADAAVEASVRRRRGDVGE